MEEYKYLIPEESGDAVSLDARKLRQIEGRLRRIFDAHGYEELLLPTFEYTDLYQGIRHQGEESMFQFVGSEGKRIALRTDFTVPIARLYNNLQSEQVKRYSYFGKVYRTQARHKGRTSELYQVGIELFGLEGFQGDRECLAIIEETMGHIDLSDLRLELGSAKFYRRLMTLVGDETLSDILNKKAISEMRKFVDQKSITGDLRQLLLALPSSFGDIEDLKQVKAFITDEELLEAVVSLEALYDVSTCQEAMLFDLCMVPAQSYYTGVMIKGYSFYSAYPILSGGRYDHLFDYFDSNVPAIGFSYHLNTLLDACAKEGEAR